MPDFLNLEDILNHTPPWETIHSSSNPGPVELAFVAFVALAALAQSRRSNRSNLAIQSTFTDLHNGK